MKIDELKQKILEDLKCIEKDEKLVKIMIRNSRDTCGPVTKDEEYSRAARIEGNELYEQAYDPFKDFKIVQLYNKSIAYAPNGSEDLAAAYGNKSAILRRMFKFKDCIVECDKALSLTKRDPLKIKLLCRKAECLKTLKLPGSKDCVEKAGVLLKKGDVPKDMKDKLRKSIAATRFHIDKVEIEDDIEEIFDKVQMQATKMIVEAEENLINMQESLRVEYSDKYKQHLVAARSFEPGEIVCVEKPYLTQVIDCKSPGYCFHCVKFLWTIVPCDHCSWYVYCSDQCKTQAWNDHHDIECSALMYMKKKIPIRNYVDLAPVGLFFKALKEAGSIEKLQEELKLIDECEGLCGEEPLSEEKYASYKTLCRTPTCVLTNEKMQENMRFCSFSLIGLAEPVLHVPYDPYQLNTLMKDDDAIFLGAFLLKLCIINSNRIHQVQHDAHNDGCHKPTNKLIVLSQLLIPLSCTPNVDYGHTYGNKCYIYAIEPIKEGTQLFSSLWLSSIYYNTPKAQRDLTRQPFYNFPCDCRACTENWCEKLYNPAKKEPMRKSKASIAKELMSEMESIKRELKTGRLSKMNLIDNQLVYRIRNVVVKAWRKFPMPSHITFEAVKLMIQIFETFFSLNSRLVLRRGGPLVPVLTHIQKDRQ